MRKKSKKSSRSATLAGQISFHWLAVSFCCCSKRSIISVPLHDRPAVNPPDRFSAAINGRTGSLSWLRRFCYREKGWGLRALRLEKRQGADLDALARPGVRRGAWIGKGGVRGPAGAAVAQGFVHLEHQRLVRPHPREPVPALLRIIGDRVGLPDPVLVVALVDHQAFGRHGLRV